MHTYHIQPSNPTLTLLYNTPREIKTYSHTKTRTLMSVVALCVITQSWKQPKCTLTDEWLNKLLYNLGTEYYSAVKRNELLIQPLGWVSKTLCWVKEVSLKRLQTVRFNLCEKAVMRENRSVAARMQLKRDGMREFGGGGGQWWNHSVSWLWWWLPKHIHVLKFKLLYTKRRKTNSLYDHFLA